MIDASTQGRLTVSTDDTVGPYINLPFSQLADVTRLLDEHQVRYRVDEHIISFNGGPEMAVVDLGRKGEASAVQAILDGVN